VVNLELVDRTTPPNILYIHSHDTGRYVQPYGHQVPTPNIQLLADQGVLFREAYCAAPTCSGSRASLLTGEYCHQNGMFGLAHRGWELYDYGHHWVHTLRRAGYESVLIGEQHISKDPHVIGYDRVIEVDGNRAHDVAPLTIEALKDMPPRSAERPWFMSVGFFETHRSFFAPTSVRDSLYSLPPENLPNTPETRGEMAAFKASARSLDQGIGAVLHGLHELGLQDDTLIVCTTDHGIAFPGAKATLFDRGTGVMMLMRGPGLFSGGKAVDGMVSHLDVFPTLCEVAGVDKPDWLEGQSMMPLLRGEQKILHHEIFSEITYHAAYQPQRAIRTNRFKFIKRFDHYRHPVLANIDDGASKDLLIASGWADRVVPEEKLYDLLLDPVEADNLIDDPAHADVAGELRDRLEEWMRETRDPLLDGPIEPPPGAIVNAQTDRSADDMPQPPHEFKDEPTAAPSS
jgi:arylsulfatase A-like enzyme